MQSNGNPQSKPTLRPSDIGRFIKLERCPRSLLFNLLDTDTQKQELGYGDVTFPELQGRNIIEKSSGDAFEDSIVSLFRTTVTDFYDCENVTLGMVAETFPHQTVSELPKTHGLSVNDVNDGNFVYHGVHASDIYLLDVDSLTDNENFAQPMKNGKETTEDEYSTVFYTLITNYTKKLLTSLAENVTTVDVDSEIAFPTPHEQVNSSSSDYRSTGNPIVVFQPALTGDIKSWEVTGNADLILLWPTGCSNADIAEQSEQDAQDLASEQSVSRCSARVLDVKLALEEQTNHQIQASLYKLLLDQIPEFSDACREITTGIITQQSSLSELTRETVPQFDANSKVTDIYNLLRGGGVLDSIYFDKSISTAEYQLNDKCSSCNYNEICYADTIEDAGLELLGIDNGTISTLKQHNIESLHDIASLANPVDEYTHPKKDPQPKKNQSRKQKYNELLSIPSIGKQLPDLIQQAQGLLQKISPNNQHIEPAQNAVHKTNTGYGTLPTTDGVENIDDIHINDGSLIRVYVNVQHDHIRDHIVGIAFTVTAGQADQSITWGKTTETLVDHPIKAHEDEYTLLTDFSTQLITAIGEIANEITVSDEYNHNDPFIHFYTYTENERELLEHRFALYTKDALIDRIKQHKYPRHDKLNVRFDKLTTESSVFDGFELTDDFSRVKALLGMRKGTEQQMVSAVLPDIEQRITLQTPTTGLINVYSQFYPSHDSCVFKHTDWTMKCPTTNETIDLRNVFHHRFFNNAEQYKQDGEHIELLLSDDSNGDVDGFYPHRVRSGAQIPVAYIWSATNRLTEDMIDELDDLEGIPYNPYMTYKTDMGEYDITTEHITALMIRLSECLQHVERGIPHKSLVYPTMIGDYS